ncbi:MAG: DUF1573 domain-containing protein [Planctomycetes bacterium]|nr:DUF1573 domain-containing protein [Planctomycetota bacterium]
MMKRERRTIRHGHLLLLIAIGPIAPCPGCGRGPAVSVVGPSTHDFGEIRDPSGAGILQHTFVLRNESSSPAVIARIMETCNCLDATSDKDGIAPGEELRLSISMSATRAQGTKSAIVTVMFEDVSIQPVQVGVRAIFRPDYAVYVRPNRLNYAQEDRAKEAVFSLVAQERGRRVGPDAVTIVTCIDNPRIAIRKAGTWNETGDILGMAARECRIEVAYGGPTESLLHEQATLAFTRRSGQMMERATASITISIRSAPQRGDSHESP